MERSVPSPTPATATNVQTRPLALAGKRGGTIKLGPKGLRLDIEDTGFAQWLSEELEQTLQELHARYEQRAED